KLGIVVVLGLFAAFELLMGARLAAGPLKLLARPVGALGAWGVLVVSTGALALLPVGDDPRGTMAHHKPVPAELADAPDVLILTVDTLRADHLGTYGGPEGVSPVLDGIAADGIVFEHASAHASWTRSSFASLWTSRIPSGHKADRKASRLPEELVLLSEVLQARGVTTANLANNINVTQTFGFDQGYDTFVYEAPAYHFGATESVFSLTFYKVVHKLREKLGGHKAIESFYQPADVVLADARAFIEANAESRWMLGVHLMEPHDPYFEHPYLDGSGTAITNGVGFARAEVERPSLDQAEYLKRVYTDEIRHMDRLLAPFVDWLKSTGRYDRTLIVITADHGEEFGEHGGFWHGTTLYEEQTHVPLIVKLPAGDLAGRRVPWQARLIDVAPTLTAALGVPPDPTWAGRDLLPDVRRDVADETAKRDAVENARVNAAANGVSAR
ncbi:MAG: sulfatase, partial [Myxococcales bacterium]|nr:sulfatase [Myxococcales bacterium]